VTGTGTQIMQCGRGGGWVYQQLGMMAGVQLLVSRVRG
jgi:hypothetical protein